MKPLFRTIIIILTTLLPLNIFSQIVHSPQWIVYSRSNSGLCGDSVTAIGFDEASNVWIGTEEEGLCIFNGSQWTAYNDLLNVPSNNIVAITNANNYMWIGTANGLTKTNGSSWVTYTTQNSGISDDGVWSINADKNHDLWLGTNWGISKLTLDNHWSSWTDASIPNLLSNHIQTIVPDGQGNLWAAFYSAYGMMKLSAANPVNAVEIDVNTISNFPADHILSIAIDWSGNVWAATSFLGLIRTNGTNATIYSKATTTNWISDNTRTVSIDQCGHLWVGTDKGAAMYDGAWTIHNQLMEQLPNDTVNAITVDAAGHIWFGTNGGVAEYKPLPQKPVLTFPLQSSVITTDSISCQWEWDCPGILKYWYEIADNSSFTNSIIDTTSASLTQFASRWDTLLMNHTTYYWRIKAENDAGWSPFSDVWSFSVNQTTGVKTLIDVPNFTLSQNFPNPCSDHTSIPFSITLHEQVTLRLYDILGREVKTLFQSELDPGQYSLSLSTSSLLPCGTYIYSLRSGNDVKYMTMKLVH